MVTTESTPASTTHAFITAPSDPLCLRDVFLSLVAAIVGMSIIVVVCNTLILVAIGLDRQLRQSTSRLVVSLAVADLLVGVAMLLDNTLILAYTHGIIEGIIIAKILTRYCAESAVYASMLHILIIALDRFMSVAMALRYNAMVTPKVTNVALICAWVTSVLATGVAWLSSPSYVRLSLFAMVTTLLVTLYCHVGYTAVIQGRKITAHTACMAPGVVTKQPRLPRATKVLSTVVGVFVVLWFPFMIGQIWFLFENDEPDRIFFSCITYAALLLGVTNSAVNILIYSFMNRDFRRVFFMMFKCNFSQSEQ